MAQLLLPHRWNRQPQGPVQIDWEHPLSNKLVSCLELRGSRVQDFASTFVLNHTIPMASSVKGRVPAFAGTGISTGVTSINGQNLFATSTNPFTVMVLARRTVSPANYVARAGATGASRTFQIYDNSASAATESPALNIRGTITRTNWGHTDSNWHLYTVSYNGSAATVYGDAALSFAVTVGTAAEETAEPITIGSRTGTSGAPITGNIAFVRIWSRALTQREHQQMWANPYQIFKPAQRLIGAVVSAPSITRPNSDVTVTGWTGDPDNTNLYNNIDETSASDTDFIISPSLGASPGPAVFGLTQSLTAGTYNVRTRARYTGTAGQIRVLLLDSSGTTVGTGSWQALTGSFTTYNLSVTTTGTAARVRLEVQ